MGVRRHDDTNGLDTRQASEQDKKEPDNEALCLVVGIDDPVSWTRFPQYETCWSYRAHVDQKILVLILTSPHPRTRNGIVLPDSARQTWTLEDRCIRLT
jgi:hypothetical protein